MKLKSRSLHPRGARPIYTTGSLAPGATLADAARSGSVSSRVNEFFNTSAVQN
jgi:hypothetical protein